jgi:hypothetical protein
MNILNKNSAPKMECCKKAGILSHILFNEELYGIGNVNITWVDILKLLCRMLQILLSQATSFPVYTHPVDSTVIGIADIKSRSKDQAPFLSMIKN